VQKHRSLNLTTQGFSVKKVRRVGSRVSVLCERKNSGPPDIHDYWNILGTKSPGQSIGADRGFRACPRLLEHGRRLLRKLKADLGCSEKKLSTSPRRALTKSWPRGSMLRLRGIGGGRLILSGTTARRRRFLQTTVWVGASRKGRDAQVWTSC
jgi:hypothetical protein